MSENYSLSSYWMCSVHNTGAYFTFFWYDQKQLMTLTGKMNSFMRGDIVGRLSGSLDSFKEPWIPQDKLLSNETNKEDLIQTIIFRKE